jgi:hypothetical protein
LFVPPNAYNVYASIIYLESGKRQLRAGCSARNTAGFNPFYFPMSNTSSSPATDESALAFAIDAINQGDLATGKQLLLRILRSDPYNDKAWLWLSATYTTVDQRKTCLLRALAINPDNQVAHLGLAKLQGSANELTGPNFNESEATESVKVNPAISVTHQPIQKPAWDERDKYKTTRRWYFVLIAIVAVAWGIVLGWLLLGPPIPEASAYPLEVGVSLTVILAPLFVAAAAVERALESTFNIIENNWRALVAYLGRGMRWLKSAETEVERARQWLADASGLYDQRMDGLIFEVDQPRAGLTADIVQQMEEVKSVLAAAEKRLTEAEKNLSSLTASASYRKAKSSACIIVGLLLGVIVARMTSLQMFAMLGVASVPAKLDVLLTGFVIGTGTYPLHSLVGMLQQFKDIFDSSKGTIARVNPTK